MEDFKGRTAVITGAGSGIGSALARRAAAEGMKLVLADFDEPALQKAAVDLAAGGATLLPVLTDVSQADQVEALAEKAFKEFGAVHLLCNNAGIGHGGPMWEGSLAEIEWVIGVNLWGVIHGVRAFLPRLLKQDADSHVVNTASVAGLVTGGGVYGLTKHAVVSLSESLFGELKARQAPVGVSVLCPGFVRTRIVEHTEERIRQLRGDPPREGDPPLEGDPPRGSDGEALAGVRQLVEGGISPEEVAASVFQAVREGRFYILTDGQFLDFVRCRMEDILDGVNPWASYVKHHPGPPAAET